MNFDLKGINPENMNLKTYILCSPNVDIVSQFLTVTDAIHAAETLLFDPCYICGPMGDVVAAKHSTTHEWDLY